MKYPKLFQNILEFVKKKTKPINTIHILCCMSSSQIMATTCTLDSTNSKILEKFNFSQI